MNMTTSRTTAGGSRVILEEGDEQIEPRVYIHNPEQNDAPEQVGFVTDGDCVAFTTKFRAFGPDVLRALADLIEES